MVFVSVCAASSHAPAARMSNSVLKLRAPVGQTAMQLPQYTHAESVSGASCSTGMVFPKPRPATAMATLRPLGEARDEPAEA